jgi:ATP-dependent DNA ligase
MSLAGLVCAGEPATCDDVLKGPQWLHEIKLDRFRTAARIDHGRAQLLTRTRAGTGR